MGVLDSDADMGRFWDNALKAQIGTMANLAGLQEQVAFLMSDDQVTSNAYEDMTDFMRDQAEILLLLSQAAAKTRALGPKAMELVYTLEQWKVETRPIQ